MIGLLMSPNPNQGVQVIEANSHDIIVNDICGIYAIKRPT